MNDVVICEPLRTPVGGYLGRLAGLSASDLATVVVREIARRAHLGEDEVDDVVLGNCNPSGEIPALGRVVALDAGLGVGVPGLQVDSRCGSGLQAVLYAAMQVASGAATLVIAGGAESMSRVEHTHCCGRASAVTASHWPTGWPGPGRRPAAATTRSPAA